MPTREEVMTALFDLWPSTFKTRSRTWLSWQDDPAEKVPNLPLLVQYEMTDLVTYSGRGIPAVQTWELRVLVYAKIPDGQTPGAKRTDYPGAKVLNPLIDAVFTAIAPPAGENLQTLGGLVTDCRIEGIVTKALGDADPSGICGAIIPVKILVP